MNRTITVKGSGSASARPDTVVISLELESKDKEYERATELATAAIDELSAAVIRAGFEKDDLKTVNFNVYTDYQSIHDGNGNYRREFDGYVVAHSLRLELVFDTNLLSKILSAIGCCTAHPSVSVAFTVKDPAALNAEVLRNAAENARSKAEILCTASGKKLGELLSIDYSWGELNVYSNTRFGMADECLGMAEAKSMEMVPEDVSVSDTVTFVWSME